MEDLFAFLLFLLIAVLSGIGSTQTRGKQARRKSRPAWPPVAPYPDPLHPSLPPEKPVRRRSDVRRSSAEPAGSEKGRQKTLVEVDEEGRQTEGPREVRPGESVQAERREFARHQAEFAASELTPSLQASIHPSVHAAAGPTAPSVESAQAPVSSLSALLQDRESLAQAFLLAEVLGKPKALRFHR